MFDKLAEFLANFGEAISPFVILKEYERAVILRCGRKHRIAGPGFHWTLPILDHVARDNVVPRTRNLNAQSLITADGKQITISAIITAQINDIAKATLEVESVDDAIIDICYGAIGARVAKTNFEDVRKQPNFSTTLKNDCNGVAEAFGIEFLKVGIADLAQCRNLRLIGIEGLGPKQ